jgi:hypothetical protein
MVNTLYLHSLNSSDILIASLAQLVEQFIRNE